VSAIIVAIPWKLDGPRTPAEAGEVLVWALSSPHPTLRLEAARVLAVLALELEATPSTVVIETVITPAARAWAEVAGADWSEPRIRDRCHTLAHKAARELLGHVLRGHAWRVDEHALLAIAGAVGAVITTAHPAPGRLTLAS
jgi:hypothetical protein